MPCEREGMIQSGLVNNGLSYSVEAMSVQAKRLDSITANLANVSTPGYKRRTSAVHAFGVGNDPNRKVEQPGLTTSVDFSQGPLWQTGQDLDLALSGEGWFVVEGEEGPMLSRGGSYRLDEAGNLLDPNGFPAAWDGDAGRIQPTGEQITIDGRGIVTQAGAQVGQLRVVSVPDEQDLEPLPGGYWRVAPQIQLEASDAVVHQGALEGSNSSAVDELIELVRVQRQFESAANLMTTLDRTYQRLNRGN